MPKEELIKQYLEDYHDRIIAIEKIKRDFYHNTEKHAKKAGLNIVSLHKDYRLFIKQHKKEQERDRLKVTIEATLMKNNIEELEKARKDREDILFMDRKLIEKIEKLEETIKGNK